MGTKNDDTTIEVRDGHGNPLTVTNKGDGEFVVNIPRDASRDPFTVKVCAPVHEGPSILRSAWRDWKREQDAERPAPSAPDISSLMGTVVRVRRGANGPTSLVLRAAHNQEYEFPYPKSGERIAVNDPVAINNETGELTKFPGPLPPAIKKGDLVTIDGMVQAVGVAMESTPSGSLTRVDVAGKARDSIGVANIHISMPPMDPDSETFQETVRKVADEMKALSEKDRRRVLATPSGYSFELLPSDGLLVTEKTIKNYERGIAESLRLPVDMLGDPNTSYPTTGLGRHPLSVVNDIVDAINAVPSCECGSEKCRTPHSLWCPAHPGE